MTNNEKKKHLISDGVSKAPFQGIQLHCVGYFPINFLERREPYEETLNLFKVSPSFGDNTSILNRPTHVFRSSPEVLEKLRQKALEDKELTHIEITEAWSDLGFPCYFHAKHKSGEEIFYDGIIFRITLHITDKEFYPQDAAELMHYPPQPKSILCLNRILKKVNNDLQLSVYTFHTFYTTLKTDWNPLRIEAYGEPSIQLSLIDPNFVRVTALRYAEYGGNFYFYVGDHQKILELIAHDLYQSNEIENWKKYISQKTEKARNCLQQASDAFAALSEPFFNLGHKLSAWSEVKKDFIYLLQESPLLYRYELLLNAYKKISEENLSGINGMTQLFVSDDEWDNRAAITHWEKYFFEGEIKNNLIVNISKQPISPNYTHEINYLETNIETLMKDVDESFDLTKDLFASAQTEFSAYSIWLAILAIIISSILGAVPFFTPSEFENSNEQENQSRLEIDSSLDSSPTTSLSTDGTLLLFETNEYIVRVFTQDNQTRMNLYGKEDKVIYMNGIPVNIEKFSSGVRYKNLQYNVAVEVFDVPILIIDDEVSR